MIVRLGLGVVLFAGVCWVAGCRLPGAPGDSIPPMNAGLSFVHPVQKPNDAALERCRLLSPECRQHVHIFVCNGLDPFCLGNLNGLSHVIRSVGFDNVYFGQVWEPARIERKIVEVRRCDPAAKVVLLGYSVGANDARRICNRLHSCRVNVDLLVYLGGDMVRDVPRSRPENAARVLNITAHGFVITGGDLLFKGDDIRDAENYRLDERHLLLPSNPEAQSLFLNALADTANGSSIK